MDWVGSIPAGRTGLLSIISVACSVWRMLVLGAWPGPGPLRVAVAMAVRLFVVLSGDTGRVG